ncbi:DUF255 domain-containing protein [Tautonia sociabilis]|uniref:DUF255 domain-containing protein n=2 Tax=Tautonia sociabilis TaxID=2080755 RepID=A0A432MLE3_9BACT|nr:DUF255 domain-containing protein [Tautonia sociabilis]
MATSGGPVGLGASDEPRAAEADERPTNRLAEETSPYLLQHAHNPVDWYPWGPEAFAKAKAEGKPIFLSIGYSSCYWCHVMERESFEDEEIASYMNEHFVNIKVDREERPDVDQIYMTAVQAITGSGGWPMSVFLTPDGRPFFGGTYFPPEPRRGMPGFPQILAAVATAWREQRDAIERDADRLTGIVRRSMANAAGDTVPLSRSMADDGVAALAGRFDPEYGGFGYSSNNPNHPKFPEPSNLIFLLDQHRRGEGRAEGGPGQGVIARQLAGPGPLEMVVETLDHMSRGGIRDHLAGGYHRYSTDRSWAVPHFEKMLYDNAQLAAVFVEAYEQTGDERWRHEAEAIFTFVAETLTDPEGGFYSTLDAETDGEEGAYYVWSRDQVEEVLGGGEDLELFARVYGLDGEPNFEGERYVLHLPEPLAEQAEALGLTPKLLEARLGPLRARLLEARRVREAPRLDDKVLTSWNGLMIAAYSDAHRVLGEERYREAAERAADFLLANLRTDDGGLLRSYRQGQAKLAAYLDDYAFLAHGLLRLHAATGDEGRLEQARELVDRMIADFADTESGGFFFTADDHESLLARPKDPIDGALPSGNSVAICVLVALAEASGEPRYLDQAGRALEAFSPILARAPAGVPMMVVGLEEYLDARPEAAARAAKGGDAQTPPANDEVLTAAATLLDDPASIVPGGTFEVALSLDVAPGWHLYANPSGSDLARPTVVTLAPGPGATLATVEYPEGEPMVLAGSTEPLPVYEGKVRLTARVLLAEDADGVPDHLTFRIDYQACNDRACLAPAMLAAPLRLATSPQ